MNKMSTIERIQAGDELERCPLPIPFGWFCVTLSDDLKIGDVQNVHLFGRDWVLFRGEDGSVGMTDPYCPHLGAHLGHGGEVVGNNIRCPFHHWEYDAQGWCKNIPYAKVMPGIARRMPVLKALPIEEKYGAIFAWYHPNGEAPSFPILDVPEFEAGDEYVPIIRGCWDIATMIQELGENGVDYPHLHYLHHDPAIPSGKPWVDENNVFHNDIGDGYIITATTGPGTSLLRFTREGVTMTVFAVTTPVDKDHSRMRWLMTYRNYPEGSRERVLAERIRQHSIGDVDGEQSAGFESVDIVIWTNKKYRPNPLLCDGDGPILMWRQWFKQFLVEPAEAA